MEVTIKSAKPEIAFSAFRPDLIRFVAFALLCIFTMSLIGCVNNSADMDVVKSVSAQERKAELLKSLERKFENPQALYELGRIYHTEGQWSQAEWHYNQALTYDPVYRQAQAAMVKLFIDNRNPAKAKTYADIYMNQVSASASQSLELALAFQELQLDEYAMACYNRALELAPNSASVHRQIGYYYLSRHNNEQAKEYFTRSFQLNPKQPDVAGELGRLGVEVRIPQSKTTAKQDN